MSPGPPPQALRQARTRARRRLPDGRRGRCASGRARHIPASQKRPSRARSRRCGFARRSGGRYTSIECGAGGVAVLQRPSGGFAADGDAAALQRPGQRHALGLCLCLCLALLSRVRYRARLSRRGGDEDGGEKEQHRKNFHGFTPILLAVSGNVEPIQRHRNETWASCLKGNSGSLQVRCFAAWIRSPELSFARLPEVTRCGHSTGSFSLLLRYSWAAR